ncbi:DUF1295 domain-containing protein [Bythopirellula goksoeyrii]|uniref:Uncharacterized protein n=1 Tax=Bythopirellula goksoeyrii TaxID=1400387 RepID=A0A5B9QIL2_9BACT|nr:DUF1295 domain-containing protein [Bythopirellula goksoeyrii]QEG36856.1 hypothetical protein Pr1d_41930 [Bythopirellula goksoeyrii]
MITAPTILSSNLVLIGCIFVFLWLVSLKLRDASIVDPCWGAGFVIIAWATYAQLDLPSQRASLLIVLITIWGLRLSLYLFWRNWATGEDRRYRAMREKHGRSFWWVSLFTVFLLQAVLMWFISWPVQLGMLLSEPLGVLDVMGTLLCMIGIAFETTGDWQLARFKRLPANKGKVLDTGLWRYTRHPNYFGDFCVWWGIYLIAVAGGAWWTIASPVVMSFFLMKVSGVALLESTIVERRPEYQEYIEKTNAFFPGPPH